MKRTMNKNKYTIPFFLILLGFLYLSSPLLSVSKEDNDLLFIISLYDHGQYELAQKQILVYEQEFVNSSNSDLLLFLKANIAFIRNEYSYSDSLYTILLSKNIEQSMLSEVLINKAYIKFNKTEYLKALSILSQAEKITTDSDLKYRIQILHGRINSKLYKPIEAQLCFEKALSLKKDDSIALYELLRLYLSLNNVSKAGDIVTNLIDKNLKIESYTSLLNLWIDYLQNAEDYYEILMLEKKLNKSAVKIPDSIMLRFSKAHILVRDNDYALQILQDVKTFRYYRMYLTGLIYAQQDKDNQADSIFAALSGLELTQQDQLPESDEDIALSSWLERIKILYKTKPEIALSYLSKFILANDLNEINPNILYTYGSLLFKSKKYQEAANALISLKNIDHNSTLAQNIQIMLSDIWFAAKINDKAKMSYAQYITNFPRGKFRLHALYNIALIDFELKNYKSASINLQTILSEANDEEIIEKAQFMLADIDFYQANYKKAIERYQQIKNKKVSSNLTNYRIAQSLYYSEDYESASELIPRLSIDSTNAYQILLLEGNIYFNMKQYIEALNIYNQASKYKFTDIEKSEVESYIALTLYRLGRFDEASSLYLKLSKEKESPQAYLIMAAKASYHAKDYQQSMLLFKKFILENPNSEYYNNALANLGSLYYNQNEYSKATQTWISLVKRYYNNEFFSDDEQIILQTTFSGLQWCLKQNPDQAALDDINNSIDSFKSSYIRFELQYLLLKIYFGSEQWSDLLKMADDLRNEFPHKENNEIRRFVAGSLSKLNRYEEADSVYDVIYKIEPTADIMTEWADLELQTGKPDSAIVKLDIALNLDKKPMRFIKLLQTATDSNPDVLPDYWLKWSKEFSPIPDKAMFIWLKWNFRKSNWNQCDSIANTLLLNEDIAIRSHAQLIKGIAQFKLEQYENAILELYKTVYLYNDIPDAVSEAEFYIIKTYIAMDQIAEANKIYNEIMELLSPNQIQELDKIFREKLINNE